MCNDETNVSELTQTNLYNTELKESYALKFFFIIFLKKEMVNEMHNLLSRAQLNEWRHFEDTVDDLQLELQQKENDYYECLIECDSLSAPECKRICKEVLM